MNARGILTAAYQVLHLLAEVGYPPAGVPPWPGLMGVPEVGYPLAEVPPQQGYPQPGLMGVPKVGYPPSQVRWGVPKVGYPPQQGYPPPGVDRQNNRRTDMCQNITFRRTTYAVGNYGKTRISQLIVIFLLTNNKLWIHSVRTKIQLCIDILLFVFSCHAWQ